MNAQLVERLEKMHRMLAKTHEEVKVLRIEVNTLHQAFSSGDDIPPPMDNKQSPMEYAFRSKCSQFLALRVKRKLFTI